jgi:NADPH2:quinone reductase
VNNVTVKFLLVYELTADERARAIADITRMLEAGRLKHNVAQTFPLTEIVAAHQAVESGKVAGNVVMTI